MSQGTAERVTKELTRLTPSTTTIHRGRRFGMEPNLMLDLSCLKGFGKRPDGQVGTSRWTSILTASPLRRAGSQSLSCVFPSWVAHYLAWAWYPVSLRGTPTSPISSFMQS